MCSDMRCYVYRYGGIRIPEDNIILNEKMEKECGKWDGDLMGGKWEGSGNWSLADKTWAGGGTWEGEPKILWGYWNGSGTWKDSGNWQAKGELFSNVKFPPGMEAMVFITAASVTAVFSMLSYFVAQFGDIISVGIGLVTFTIALGVYWFTKSTTDGKWEATGTWEDIGDFRILKLHGKLKLGPHNCTLDGVMKDTKPK